MPPSSKASQEGYERTGERARKRLRRGSLIKPALNIMTNNHTGRLVCSLESMCSLIPAALPFQFLHNVTSGSFLEADQPREINVPLQPHACNAALRRIIDEGGDIMQRRFRFHQSNCPQLKGGLSEESEHSGAESPGFQTQTADCSISL